MQFIFLLILAGAAWWGMQQSKKGVAWGRNLATGCALAATVLAVIQLFPENKSPEVMEERVDDFAYAAGVGLGRHLSEAYPESRVRILYRTGGHGLFPPALADGLEASLRGNVKSVERVLVNGWKRPTESEDDGDALAESDATGVSLKAAIQGLEENVDLLILLFSPTPKLLAFLGSGRDGNPALAVACLDVSPLLAPLGDELIQVVLAQRPNVRMHKNDGSLMEPPSDPMKAFSSYFEILTPQTVGAFKGRNPNLVL